MPQERHPAFKLHKVAAGQHLVTLWWKADGAACCVRVRLSCMHGRQVHQLWQGGLWSTVAGTWDCAEVIVMRLTSKGSGGCWAFRGPTTKDEYQRPDHQWPCQHQQYIQPVALTSTLQITSTGLATAFKLAAVPNRVAKGTCI